jgi:hypothetical protein
MVAEGAHFKSISLDDVRRQSAGENNRSIGKFHEEPAHAPVVSFAGGARCSHIATKSKQTGR